MPLCPICKTYFVIEPCPKCNMPTSRKVNIAKTEKIGHKTICLTSNVDELDFIWSQIIQRTVQRVRINNIMLRHGFLQTKLSNNRIINFEFIGSTFNQSFLSRLERLYPGIDDICIVSDVVGQNFPFSSLKELLDDILLVNRSRIKKICVLWLEPYINIQNEYDTFKLDVIDTLNGYLSSKNYLVEIIQVNLPMYSSQLFSNQLKEFLFLITRIEELKESLNFPLRPLFRTFRPILDPNISNRVVILDIERASTEIIRVRGIENEIKGIKELEDKIKCLACNLVIKKVKNKCLTCKSHFCDNCTDYLLNSKDDFCFGSIYHGIHRFALL